MRLVDYLDKGASLGPDAACLTTDGETLSYAEVQQLSFRIAAGLAASGVRPGGKVAILAANDPIAFSCVFGISRAGAIWCPINPSNEAAENRELLDQFDCEVLIYQAAFAPLVNRIRDALPKVHTFVCLDQDPGSGPIPHATEKTSPYRKMLSSLWRESPVPMLDPGERLATMASLLHVDRHGASLVAALIRGPGLAPTVWLRASSTRT